MGALRILHLSDGRPGHYHLAEGVIAALGRVARTEVTTLTIRRRWIVPARTLRQLIVGGLVSPGFVLRLGYGLTAAELDAADLIVSAGGQTLPANIAAARALGTENIFVGSLRGVDTANFSLVVTSYERHRDLPRHLVSLKPSALDPEALGRPKKIQNFGAAKPPKIAGLLIGGDSGLFKYSDDEWRRLLEFACEVSRAWGTRWLISTSRRTAPEVARAASDLAGDSNVVADFIDYRQAGPGTLETIFSKADLIMCTEDSSTMISEAAWAQLPVIGVSPAHHAFKPEEREYRQLLARNNWCRFLPIARLTVDEFAKVLGEIKPIDENPLDRLARDLKKQLPELFAK